MSKEFGDGEIWKMAAQDQRLMWWVVELQTPSRSKVMTDRVSLGGQSDLNFFDAPMSRNVRKSQCAIVICLGFALKTLVIY